MTKRKNFSSGATWEHLVGYSRAVAMDNLLEVSGTVAADENGVVGKGDFYVQTQYILKKITSVLEQAGFAITDVIRTRIFVTDITRWEEVGKAHGEVFSAIRPATSMVEVSSLIHPDYLVEIEVTAMK